MNHDQLPEPTPRSAAAKEKNSDSPPSAALERVQQGPILPPFPGGRAIIEMATGSSISAWHRCAEDGLRDLAAPEVNRLTPSPDDPFPCRHIEVAYATNDRAELWYIGCPIPSGETKMGAKRKLKLGDAEVTAEEIEFEVEREAWNTYILGDGTSLKLKAVLAEVLRVEGQYAPNGDPVYIVNATPVVSTSAPETLKKKE